MYKITFCDPFMSRLTDLGMCEPLQVVEKFESINWSDHLGHMKNAGNLRAYLSPSFCVENTELNQGIEIWAMGDKDKPEWYIFYSRPQTVSSWFGFKKTFREQYTTEITRQRKENVIRCLQAFVNNDFEFLKRKVK